MSVSSSIELPPAVGAVSSSGSNLPQPHSGGEMLAAVPGGSPPAAAPAATGASATAADGDAVASAAKQIAAFLSTSKTDIAFALDQSSGRMVVRITDAATGKTIRQIPSEVVLRIAEELKQNKTVANLQFDEKA